MHPDSFWNVGMVIAQSLGTVRNHTRVNNRGVKHIMFTKYIKGLNKQDCPVVLSITDTTAVEKIEARIQRNSQIRDDTSIETNDIYVRAREIYYRARRHRPVRAASIF